MRLHRGSNYGVLFFVLTATTHGTASLVQQGSAEARTESVSSEPDISQLIEALRDKNVISRLNAIEQLRQRGAKADPATDALIDALRDGRPDPDSQLRVCVEAASALPSIGQSAVDKVVAKLNAAKTPAEYHVYALAVRHIGPSAKDAAQHLTRKLAEGYKPEVSMFALSALGKSAVPAMPHCVMFLDDENFHIRSAALDALGEISEFKPLPNPAIRRILEMTKDGVGSNRKHAAACLGRIGVVDDFDIVGALVQSTGDRLGIVRDEALISLARIGAKAKPALPHLETLIKKNEYRNRVNAARTIWMISGEAKESVDTLMELTKHQDYSLDAIDALAEMKSAAGAAIPQLRDLLDSPDPDVRMQSVRAIGFIGTTESEVITTVNEMQQDIDPDAARAAQNAFGRLQQKK